MPGCKNSRPAKLLPARLPKMKNRKKTISIMNLKSRVHYRLLDLLDLSRLAAADDAQLFQDIKRGIDIILSEEVLP